MIDAFDSNYKRGGGNKREHCRFTSGLNPFPRDVDIE